MLRVCAPSPGRTVPQTRWSKAGQQEMCPLNNSGGGAVLPSTEQTFRRTHCALQEGLMFQVKISPGCPGSSKTFLLTKVDGGENDELITFYPKSKFICLRDYSLQFHL